MANSYLHKTSGTPTSQKTGTFSFWVKRSGLGSTTRLFNNHVTSVYYGYIDFTGGDQLRIAGDDAGTIDVKTNRVFRDNSAWYHIVIAIDSSQSTAADRVKVYVNGTQETSFASSTYPSQNDNLNFFNTSAANGHVVGAYYNGSAYSGGFDGYMSHVAFVDGQQLAPTVFGETDSTSGIWKFKSPSGVTWGNNGFHLKFENSGAMGTDSSGNSNTFTVQGNLNQALDTPSNVSCTWSSATKDAGALLSRAATQMARGSGDGHCTVMGTLGVSSGKWYYECKLDTAGSAANANSVGIVRVDSDASETSGKNAGDDSTSDYFYCGGGEYQGHGGSGSYGNSYTSGDIIGVAFDLDNNKLYFHKNGTYQNSGVPTSGSTGTGAKAITAGDFFVPACGGYDGTIWRANFGNGYFGTSAISSAGSNGNGSLFEYDVPNGYYALTTKNINTYG
jgi:hypothetical protein